MIPFRYLAVGNQLHTMCLGSVEVIKLKNNNFPSAIKMSFILYLN